MKLSRNVSELSMKMKTKIQAKDLNKIPFFIRIAITEQWKKNFVSQINMRKIFGHISYYFLST